MTRGKNFVGQITPSIIDGEYIRCHFSQPAPIEVAGKQRGVRLFPGDDTPRVFRDCCLVNCEVPPGSTIIGGNTAIKVVRALTGSDTITVDGEEIVLEYYADIIHGRVNPDTLAYEDKTVPEEVEVK